MRFCRHVIYLFSKYTFADGSNLKCKYTFVGVYLHFQMYIDHEVRNVYLHFRVETAYKVLLIKCICTNILGWLTVLDDTILEFTDDAYPFEFFYECFQELQPLL
eukprot:97145_1